MIDLDNDADQSASSLATSQIGYGCDEKDDQFLIFREFVKKIITIESINAKGAVVSLAALMSLPLSGILIIATTINITSIESSMALAASLTAAISLVTLTLRYCNFQSQIAVTYLLFIYLTHSLINTNLLVQFFIIYEFFLLPSAVLVWFFSPNKRGVKTTVFFLLWTQFGSILILIATSYIVEILNSLEFYKENFGKTIPIIYQMMIIFGFLIKIPIFPFYFWLTKTHVEAVTSFSIFLSGFLVKIALFGLYKYTVFLNKIILTLSFIMSLISASTTSMLFLHQVDLKKTIAYATVQEMSQLAMCTSVYWTEKVWLVAIFLVTHTLLSAKYFLINDIVYRIYRTRSILLIQGLGISSPKLSIVLVSTLALFRGLPFTIKNTVEVSLMSLLSSINGKLTAIWASLVIFTGNVTFSYIFLKTTNFSPQKLLQHLDIGRDAITLLSFIVLLMVYLQQSIIN